MPTPKQLWQAAVARPAQPYPPSHGQRHPKHVGTCPQCQRVAKQRAAAQLAAATAARQAWEATAHNA